MPLDITCINSLSREKAREAFFHCSGSNLWTDEMVSGIPYRTSEELLARAEAAWGKLGKSDWLDAFKIHPKIGDIESLKKRFASTAHWAQNEQSGVQTADHEVIERLAQGNKLYEERFGYIFIVCATGKSAPEMLALLEERLNNAPDEELEIAKSEQKKITVIRLEKLQA